MRPIKQRFKQGLILATDLMGHRPVNEVNGDIATTTGTLPFVTSIPDVGQGRQFTAGNFTFPNTKAPNHTSSFTVMVLQKFTGNTLAWQSMISIDNDWSFYSNGFEFYLATDTISNAAINLTANNAEVPGKTNNLTCVYDVTTQTAYINGVQQFSPVASTVTWGTDKRFIIGSGQGTEWCQSKLAGVFVWNRALSRNELTEIGKNYTALFETKPRKSLFYNLAGVAAAEGALSSSGVATVNFIGKAIDPGVLSSSGVATVNFNSDIPLTGAPITESEGSALSPLPRILHDGDALKIPIAENVNFYQTSGIITLSLLALDDSSATVKELITIDGATTKFLYDGGDGILYFTDGTNTVSIDPSGWLINDTLDISVYWTYLGIGISVNKNDTGWLNSYIGTYAGSFPVGTHYELFRSNADKFELLVGGLQVYK